MTEFRDLSEQERRRLYQDFHRAAEALQGEAAAAPLMAKTETERQKRFQERLRLGEGRQVRRPSWGLRLRIDNYASSEGFEICGVRELFASFLAFLRPHQDLISRRFARCLLRDNLPQSTTAGFSLSRTLLEIRRRADFLFRWCPGCLQPCACWGW